MTIGATPVAVRCGAVRCGAVRCVILAHQAEPTDRARAVDLAFSAPSSTEPPAAMALGGASG